MGYTHYWDFKNDNLPSDKYEKIVKDVKVIEAFFDAVPTVSKSGGGYYPHPKEDIVQLFDFGGGKRGVEYRNDEFGFNGDASKGYLHETFSINSGTNTGDFCKTERKPYDLAVCLALLVIKFHVRSTKISTDGDNEDWGHAYELFGKIFNNRSTTFIAKEGKCLTMIVIK
jgi:hypothetical protein